MVTNLEPGGVICVISLSGGPRVESGFRCLTNQVNRLAIVVPKAEESPGARPFPQACQMFTTPARLLQLFRGCKHHPLSRTIIYDQLPAADPRLVSERATIQYQLPAIKGLASFLSGPILNMS